MLLAFTDNAIVDGNGPDFEIFGESTEDDFILVEISEDGVRIWMRGDRSRIVQFAVRDEQGKAMITTADPIERAAEGDPETAAVPDASEAESGEWIGSIQISEREAGAPKTLEVIYALAMEEQAFPFHAAVPR